MKTDIYKLAKEYAVKLAKKDATDVAIKILATHSLTPHKPIKEIIKKPPQTN